jgi:hypothetical protein
LDVARDGEGFADERAGLVADAGVVALEGAGRMVWALQAAIRMAWVIYLISASSQTISGARSPTGRGPG